MSSIARDYRRETDVCLFLSTNLVIILVMMQASKKIPFDDPNVLNGVRALYVLSNLIIVGVYVYIGMQIDSKKGTERFEKSPI